MTADETLAQAQNTHDSELFAVGQQMKIAEQQVELIDLRERMAGLSDVVSMQDELIGLRARFLLNTSKLGYICAELGVNAGLSFEQPGMEFQKAVRATHAALWKALEFCRGFAEQCQTAEDRSNLDGDSAEVVLTQINEAADEALATIINAALARGQAEGQT